MQLRCMQANVRCGGGSTTNASPEAAMPAPDPPVDRTGRQMGDLIVTSLKPRLHEPLTTGKNFSPVISVWF